MAEPDDDAALNRRERSELNRLRHWVARNGGGRGDGSATPPGDGSRACVGAPESAPPPPPAPVAPRPPPPPFEPTLAPDLDPSTEEGRALLAREAIAVLRAIAVEGRWKATNLDRIGAARELSALGGYRKAAPAVKATTLPFQSLLARPSDVLSDAPDNAKRGEAKA